LACLSSPKICPPLLARRSRPLLHSCLARPCEGRLPPSSVARVVAHSLITWHFEMAALLGLCCRHCLLRSWNGSLKEGAAPSPESRLSAGEPHRAGPMLTLLSIIPSSLTLHFRRATLHRQARALRKSCIDERGLPRSAGREKGDENAPQPLRRTSSNPSIEPRSRALASNAIFGSISCNGCCCCCGLPRLRT